MAYLDLNERAVVAMASRIGADLNANIDAINANTVANPGRNQTRIDYPAQILDAPPISGQLTSFPIVAIADGPMTLTDDVGWGATGLYEVIVLAYISDPDPVALAWKLRRYAQAVATTALKGRNIDGGAWGTICRKIVPGKRVSRQDPAGATEYMSWVAVVIEAKDEQDTP